MTNYPLHGLYGITDSQLLKNNFLPAIEQSLKGGCRIIQYRDKSHDQNKRLAEAQAIRQLCDQYQSVFIINDDIELAIAVDADGVHLGRDDSDINKARSKLGDNKIIGISCYDQLQLAIDAEQAGADYIAFGAFFSSSTKPEASHAPLSLIAKAQNKINLPICCIGGINRQNGSALIAEGADMLAVISDLYRHGTEQQQIEIASRQLSRLFSA